MMMADVLMMMMAHHDDDGAPFQPFYFASCIRFLRNQIRSRSFVLRKMTTPFKRVSPEHFIVSRVWVSLHCSFVHDDDGARASCHWHWMVLNGIECYLPKWSLNVIKQNLFLLKRWYDHPTSNDPPKRQDKGILPQSRNLNSLKKWLILLKCIWGHHTSCILLCPPGANRKINPPIRPQMSSE